MRCPHCNTPPTGAVKVSSGSSTPADAGPRRTIAVCFQCSGVAWLLDGELVAVDVEALEQPLRGTVEQAQRTAAEARDRLAARGRRAMRS